MIVRPWEEGDTERLILQDSQSYMSLMLDELDLQPLAAENMAWSCELDEGIMGIGGIIPQWENRAIAWAMVSKEAGRCFLQIHKETKRQIDAAPFRRIEATIDVGFKPGHRWVEMLGFEMEGYLRHYRPDGGDQIMYARIKDVRT